MAWHISVSSVDSAFRRVRGHCMSCPVCPWKGWLLPWLQTPCVLSLFASFSYPFLLPKICCVESVWRILDSISSTHDWNNRSLLVNRLLIRVQHWVLWILLWAKPGCKVKLYSISTRLHRVWRPQSCQVLGQRRNAHRYPRNDGYWVPEKHRTVVTAVHKEDVMLAMIDTGMEQTGKKPVERVCCVVLSNGRDHFQNGLNGVTVQLRQT